MPNVGQHPRISRRAIKQKQNNNTVKNTKGGKTNRSPGVVSDIFCWDLFGVLEGSLADRWNDFWQFFFEKFGMGLDVKHRRKDEYIDNYCKLIMFILKRLINPFNGG